MVLLKVLLENGETVEYDDKKIGEGGLVRVYFTPDKKAVVCFFKDKNTARDTERFQHLLDLIGKYNPTFDPDPLKAEYWKSLLSWPSAVVVEPEIGYVRPVWPDNFFFNKGLLKGKPKEVSFFTLKRARKLIDPSELGDWSGYLEVCLCISRAVNRLHSVGLAHCDLSGNNILVDPITGKSMIIGVDSVISPGFLPDVLGTPGYIAPEVLATANLPLDDSRRVLPSVSTDHHALAMLIYQFLLLRHPLRGPKSFNEDPSEDERLAMGEKALFIEHPFDTSNRPRGIKIPYQALGPYLAPLVEQAFIDGLHSPEKRPSAQEWETALMRTIELHFMITNFRLLDYDPVVVLV